MTVKRHRGCDCHLCRQSVRLPKPISSFLRIIYPEPLLLLSLCSSCSTGWSPAGQRGNNGTWREAQERWVLGSLSLCGTQTKDQCSWRLLATQTLGSILGESLTHTLLLPWAPLECCLTQGLSGTKSTKPKSHSIPSMNSTGSFDQSPSKLCRALYTYV